MGCFLVTDYHSGLDLGLGEQRDHLENDWEDFQYCGECSHKVYEKSGKHFPTSYIVSSPLQWKSSCSIVPKLRSHPEKFVYLHLDSNWLNGTIPSNLSAEDMSDNELQGNIFPSMGDIFSLTLLNFLENELSRSIPSSQGNLSALSELCLFESEFSGNLPPSFAQTSSLAILNLKNEYKYEFNVEATASAAAFKFEIMQNWWAHFQHGFPVTVIFILLACEAVISLEAFPSGFRICNWRFEAVRIMRSSHMLTFKESLFVGNPELSGNQRNCSYEVPQSNPPLSKVNGEEQEESHSEEDVRWSIGVDLQDN
eukprot:Gb_17149 [translate_table: standard]